jgi:uncharacterized protein (DUF433 family)
VSRLDRITTDPAFCHGLRTVRGLRYRMQMLPERLWSGMTVDDVLADPDPDPDLEREDPLAALGFGVPAAGGRRVVQLGA